MTDEQGKEYDWAAEAEPFYIFLGIYVASFQWIESKLEEILLLHAGFDRRAETLERLARTRNQEKIKAVGEASLDGDRFPPAAANKEWNERVARLVENLDAERKRRNTILHSAYWMRGLEQGLNAIRTNKRRANAALQFDTEEMNRERMDAILKEIALLAFSTGQLHLQLVAWTP